VRNYYQILGVSNDSPKIVIDAAFKVLMEKYQNNVTFEQELKEVINAYNVISNPQTRAEYDHSYNANDHSNTTISEEKVKSTIGDNLIYLIVFLFAFFSLYLSLGSLFALLSALTLSLLSMVILNLYRNPEAGVKKIYKDELTFVSFVLAYLLIYIPAPKFINSFFKNGLSNEIFMQCFLGKFQCDINSYAQLIGFTIPFSLVVWLILFWLSKKSSFKLLSFVIITIGFSYKIVQIFST